MGSKQVNEQVGRHPLQHEVKQERLAAAEEAAIALTDAALVAQCRDGDSSAFDALVRRHQDRIYHAVCRLVGDREDALDVAQEVFVRAYRSLDGFRGDAQFSTWLYRIAVNMARNHLRDRSRKGRNKGVPFDPIATNAPAPASMAASPLPSPAETAAADELDAVLQGALAHLPEACREAFVLRIFENLSYEEIAAAMECPAGTVKSRLNQARRLLREQLEALAVL